MPDFHLNIVFLWHTRDANIGFNTLTEHLTAEDKILTVVDFIEWQHIFEYMLNEQLSIFALHASSKRFEFSALFDC